jgi:hypothetical protein
MNEVMSNDKCQSSNETQSSNVKEETIYFSHMVHGSMILGCLFWFFELSHSFGI